MRLKSKDVFVETRGQGKRTDAQAFYTRSTGVEKLRYVGTTMRSDTLDTMERYFSSDNGRTWSGPEQIAFITSTPEGIRREYAQPGFVDLSTDRLVELVLVGTLPSDDPLEGLKSWHLDYRVSTDGGRTWSVREQVIQKGDCTPEHPLDCVWIGRNSVMVGDTTCRPIRTREGLLLFPAQITPVGRDGQYINPGGGYTYHEGVVLIGRWADGNRIEWAVSARVAIDPARSTRGAIEPTLAEMPDGRILMVLRGSNDVKPELPGYKWCSVSQDGGRSWSPAEPWTYTDGGNFFSPSACSQLLAHSSGRYFWLGNISEENPQGNLPRYPMVFGEVDPRSMRLVRESVTVVDDRMPDEHPRTMLSNFMAEEDRESGEILLYMSRPFTRSEKDWTSDAYLYRIEI